MPDMNGIQVLEQIKKAPDAPPVIMITADPQLDDVKNALKLGAYDFVGKPLDFEELRVTIQNALEATRLRTEVQSSARRGPAPHRIPRGRRGLSEDHRTDELRAESRCQRGDHHPDSG